MEPRRQGKSARVVTIIEPERAGAPPRIEQQHRKATHEQPARRLRAKGGCKVKGGLAQPGAGGTWADEAVEQVCSLRADERMESESDDDDLVSPLPNLQPLLPAFSAKVLRNNETESDFLTWCACAPADEPDGRLHAADEFRKWCASGSTKRADRLAWARAFSDAPSHLRRRQLEALALSLSKAQLRALALAHQSARRLRAPAIQVTVPPDEHGRRLVGRARLVHARCGRGAAARGRSESPARSSRSGDSTESPTARRLDLSRAGNGHACAFAGIGGFSPVGLPSTAAGAVAVRAAADRAISAAAADAAADDVDAPQPMSPALEHPADEPWHAQAEYALLHARRVDARATEADPERGAAAAAVAVSSADAGMAVDGGVNGVGVSDELTELRQRVAQLTAELATAKAAAATEIAAVLALAGAVPSAVDADVSGASGGSGGGGGGTESDHADSDDEFLLAVNCEYSTCPPELLDEPPAIQIAQRVPQAPKRRSVRLGGSRRARK